MLTIGHRGAAGYEPENTLLSFSKAIDLNVEMIEFDVRLCKSGEVVIFHDDSLERTTNGNGFVIDKTLDELRKLDAGKGQKIPTLDETFDFIGNKTKINVELKGKSTVESVIQTIRHFIENRKSRLEDILVSSFMPDELMLVRKEFPTIKIGLLFVNLPKDFQQIAAKLQAFSIHLNFYFLTKNDVDQVHAAGYRLYTYTVNKPEDKARMKAWGVDGIFTDFP